MYVPLSHGKVAVVDNADYTLVSQYKWRATQSHDHLWYAVTGSRPYLTMHALILGTVGKAHIDHRDRDGLNNQRYNLRECTLSQNAANRRKRSGSVSQFKGVGWNIVVKKWIARIRKDGIAYHLGYFVNEEDAARAYNVAAARLFGEFANLNEIAS